MNPQRQKADPWFPGCQKEESQGDDLICTAGFTSADRKADQTVHFE